MASDSDTDRFEATTELDDEHAHRGVVEDFDNVLLRVTGSNIEGEDGVDLDLSQFEPQDNAVFELIEGDRVLARFIQAGDCDD